MKLTHSQLQAAAHHAAEIVRLEAVRESISDTFVSVRVGGPSAVNPLGLQQAGGGILQQLGSLGSDASVSVRLPAEMIRAEMVGQLEPHYRALREMGIELQR